MRQRCSRHLSKRDTRGDPIFWPQPPLDPVLIQALYCSELKHLQTAVRRMERRSRAGLRHFSAVHRAVPLSKVAVATMAIANNEREERRQLGMHVGSSKDADDRDEEAL